MTEAPESGDEKGAPIFTVWKAYEDVAMHFNDLLLKLRIQALGGVAALAVLASVFSNFRSYYFQGTWVLAAACFFGLLLIWCAIWALDRLYYNRLLIGSVIAIASIEQLSKTQTHIKELDLSTRIGEAIEGKTPKVPRLWGVDVFYAAIFVLLLTGLAVTTSLACNYPLEDRASDVETSAARSPARQRAAPDQPREFNPLRKYPSK